MKLGIVIPVGPGRVENLQEVLKSLVKERDLLEAVVVVLDGHEGIDFKLRDSPIQIDLVQTWNRHEPGMEQPRNIGVRELERIHQQCTHVWFLDSDVVLQPYSVEMMLDAIRTYPHDRAILAPYDWLPQGLRPESDYSGDIKEFYTASRKVVNDPRWEMFRRMEVDDTSYGDLSVGLASFSGNLVWPIKEFKRVGGFWSELHHGRCEDGELGLRAVAMGVGIGVAKAVRGFHLWHPENTPLKVERNKRDVPMLDARHHWLQGSGVFLVDRDGKAFDVNCSKCGQMVHTVTWWDHVRECGVESEIKAVF